LQRCEQPAALGGGVLPMLQPAHSLHGVNWIGRGCEHVGQQIVGIERDWREQLRETRGRDLRSEFRRRLTRPNVSVVRFILFGQLAMARVAHTKQHFNGRPHSPSTSSAPKPNGSNPNGRIIEIELQEIGGHPPALGLAWPRAPVHWAAMIQLRGK
jgi:hypothetical protein